MDHEPRILNRFGQPIHSHQVYQPLSRAEKALALGGLALAFVSAGESPLLAIFPMTGHSIIVLMLAIQSGVFLFVGVGLTAYVGITHITGEKWSLRELLVKSWIWVFLVILALLAAVLGWQNIHMHNLQSSVEALGERHLSDSQKAYFREVLANRPDLTPILWIVSYPECFECRAYAWEFATEINTLQKKAQNVGVFKFPDEGPQLSTLWRGVMIGGVHDPKHLTDDERTLTMALDAAHIPYSISDKMNLKVTSGNTTKGALVLFIAPKQG